jgi:hypothetical protein
MYGISDFFSVMFEDTSKTNLLLEAESEAASAVYSKFLQLTSTISLEDIQTTLGQSIKLVTIKTTDKILGEVNLYKLPEEILSSRYIANRPLLPTTLFEQTVDFRIERSTDGELRIRFAKDISNAGFSTRLLADETTKEYALWFVDTEIDEQWIYDNYAVLLDVKPQVSTEIFKNFIKGLYYVYLNGPTLELLRKGLNLCLGVPLARDSETILDIRLYLETDQYIVVTDSNQYLIPYGLTPSVAVGDTLNVGDELSRWVEIKDYIQDGDWWINLRIPPNLIATIPEGQPSRYATKNSHFDYLMRNYLKKHTFLVNVNVSDFKNVQAFQQISEIVNKAKPSYTRPIYIWTIPANEIITVNENLNSRRDQFRTENLTSGIDSFYRNNTSNPASRGNTQFLRYTVPNWVSQMMGTDTYMNGNPTNIVEGTSIGFVNPNKQYRDNDNKEKAWLRTIRDRGSELITATRNKMGFTRNGVNPTVLNSTVEGKPLFHLRKRLNIPDNMLITPMYLTTQADLTNKCTAAGIFTPSLAEWCFDLLNPKSESINSLMINEGVPVFQVSMLIDNFPLFATRGVDVYYLSNFMPDMAFRFFKPKIEDLSNADYLIGVRIHENVVGIYLVSTNNPVSDAMYSVVTDNDNMQIDVNSRPNRGFGIGSSPYYLLRGRGNLGYNKSMLEINAAPINDNMVFDDTLTNNAFSDTINIVPTIIKRDGTFIKHRTELK